MYDALGDSNARLRVNEFFERRDFTTPYGLDWLDFLLMKSLVSCYSAKPKGNPTSVREEICIREGCASSDSKKRTSHAFKFVIQIFSFRQHVHVSRCKSSKHMLLFL